MASPSKSKRTSARKVASDAAKKNVSTTTALFRLDDTEDPGLARVRVLSKSATSEAHIVKALTGHDIYKCEVIEIVKPSTASVSSPAKPGQKKTISDKHLNFEG